MIVDTNPESQHSATNGTKLGIEQDTHTQNSNGNRAFSSFNNSGTSGDQSPQLN